MSERDDNRHVNEYVTAMVGGQLFGLPILRVQDVFIPERLTRVPLSPPEVAGVLNLRGRIVTLIDVARRLELERTIVEAQPMAIGVDAHGESYALLIDSIGEVLKLDDKARESNPVNMDPRLARVSSGVYRLDAELLVVLDVDRVLELPSRAVAA
ncbi:MAG: chemotaxis protein CheW [Pseudolabrys sp.]|nr:chemotaxis protein CheW [Pseudolabrys sp.]MBV9954082.1 chemotaxis protein CheW [Pseudolabrys sp.]